MAGKIVNGFEACMKELADTRCSLRALDKQLFPCGGPQPKSLIEISGASGSGKSLLLYEIMARSLIERASDIVFIDLNHTFDVLYFELVLRRMLNKSSYGTMCATDQNIMVERCLDKVNMLNCYAPEDYTVALETAEITLLQNANCALVAIDGVDAFYWLDTFECPLRMQTHYARNIERLKRLCERHNMCCFYTVDTYYLEVKQQRSKGSRTTWIPPVTVDYRLQLNKAPNGERSVNGAPFSIADDGICLAVV